MFTRGSSAYISDKKLHYTSVDFTLEKEGGKKMVLYSTQTSSAPKFNLHAQSSNEVYLHCLFLGFPVDTSFDNRAFSLLEPAPDLRTPKLNLPSTEAEQAPPLPSEHQPPLLNSPFLRRRSSRSILSSTGSFFLNFLANGTLLRIILL